MKKCLISARKRNEVSQIWFYSKKRYEAPNLVLKYTEQGESYYFTIGTYCFDSITGVSTVTPLPGMEKMDIEKVLSVIRD